MGEIVSSGRPVLIGDEISPYYGILTKADGTQVKYEKGKNQEEEKMQRREEFQKVYTELCDKYGKKYVDAVLTDRKPVIGMPEELFVLAFKAELASESNSLRLYRVKGFGFTGINNSILSDQVLKWSVWVDNGRVSDIKYWD